MDDEARETDGVARASVVAPTVSSSQRIEAMDETRVRAGDTVLIDHGSDKRLSFLVANPKAKLKVGGTWISAAGIVGSRFGSRFEARSGKLVPCVGKSISGWEKQSIDASMSKVERNNREIVDDGSAQALSKFDIDSLQKKGTIGTALVDKIIENSATFVKKTEFAQEKYKKKKMKKHAAIITVRKPTASLICETCFLGKSGSRIHFLREDTLAVLLSMANVGAHARVLVVDYCGGLIAGAVAERLGGHGEIAVAFFGKSPPPLDIMKSFNFEDSIWDTVFRASVDQLSSAGSDESSGEARDDANNVKPVSVKDDAANETSAKTPSLPAEEHSTKKRKVTSASDKQIKKWQQSKFDSMIIAAPNFDQVEVMKALLPMMLDSGNFVAYSNYSQPLAECLHHLRSQRIAVDVEMGELWMREYQVLPGRTHPHMNTEGTGGFILSGIKVHNETDDFEGTASKKPRNSS